MFELGLVSLEKLHEWLPLIVEFGEITLFRVSYFFPVLEGT